jgi:hypothetical protein
MCLGASGTAYVGIECNTLAVFSCSIQGGKLVGIAENGAMIMGRFSFRSGYPSFVGKSIAPPCRYKLQAVSGYF